MDIYARLGEEPLRSSHLGRQLLVDGYIHRPEERRVRDVLRARERARPVGQRRDGDAVHDVLRVREAGVEGDGVPVRPHVLQRHRDGDVERVDVAQRRALEPLLRGGGDQRPVRAPRRRGRVDAEVQRLVGRAGDGREQVELAEDLERDDVGVGARAGHDEVLQEREGEVADAGGEEGQLAGDLGADEAVEAALLALLAEDGGDDARQLRVARGEVLGDVLQGAEEGAGEERGEGDGVPEGGGREDVLAGLDGRLVLALEEAGDAELVECFLLIGISKSFSSLGILTANIVCKMPSSQVLSFSSSRVKP